MSSLEWHFMHMCFGELPRKEELKITYLCHIILDYLKKGKISLTILGTGHVWDVLEDLINLVKCELLIDYCEISEHLRQGTHTEKTWHWDVIKWIGTYTSFANKRKSS